jgi:hypothetical protein
LNQKTEQSDAVLTPETRHLKPIHLSMPYFNGAYQWKKRNPLTIRPPLPQYPAKVNIRHESCLPGLLFERPDGFRRSGYGFGKLQGLETRRCISIEAIHSYHPT